MTPEEFYGMGQDLMQDYPTYYHEDDFMQQYLMALGFEYETLQRLSRFLSDGEAQAAMANNLPNDLEPIMAAWFARTATGRALELWEEMLAIPHDNTFTLDQRRSNILVRLQTTNTPTPEYIKNQLLQYADEVEIIEHFELPGSDVNRLSFDVHILRPTGIQDNVVVQIQQMLRRIKPSHLHYMIIYSELTWASLADMTWAELGDTTWKNLTV